MRSTVRPVPGAAALRIETEEGRRSLVVADVHLGLGGTSERPGGPPEGSAGVLAGTLRGWAEQSGAGRIVIAGDVKHPIRGTPPPLRPVVFDFFAALLGAGLEVDVVLGNHDAGLVRYLPREVRVHAATGAVIDGVGVFHGHTWPTNAVLRAPTLVVGHLHPGFRLAPSPDDPEGKRRCWLRVAFPPPAARPRRRRRHELRAREMIVLPAFHPLAGTEALNRQRPARGRTFLYRRFLANGVTRAYLLDGTDLGVLTPPVPPRPNGSSRRASRAP